MLLQAVACVSRIRSAVLEIVSNCLQAVSAAGNHRKRMAAWVSNSKDNALKQVHHSFLFVFVRLVLQLIKC